MEWTLQTRPSCIPQQGHAVPRELRLAHGTPPADYDHGKQPGRPVTASRFERASGAFNEGTGSMIMTALDLPQTGCWLLTARYAEERPLTFVVSVP